jgi:serine protease DegQ
MRQWNQVRNQWVGTKLARSARDDRRAPAPTPASARRDVFAAQQLSIIDRFSTCEAPLLRRFWLVFAQACTLCLAALFVVTTLRPDLVARFGEKSGQVVLLQETSTPVSTPTVASFSDAAKKSMPAVVGIYTSKEMRQRGSLQDDPLLRRYFPDLAERLPRQRLTSLGSGVIVSAEGYVLTNNHVIEGADDIQLVLSDGRRIGARVRGTDPESDLAVLKAEGENFPAVTFGTLDRVQVGDFVLAIGNPYGFGNTVTLGIVSALGRNHLGINRFEDFIQTDAAINPGNSGGALVDTAGNLIGINSTIFSQSGGSLGIGFAIPVSLARNVLEQIIRDGAVTRGWLGLEPQDVTVEVARALALEYVGGVLIRGIVKNGPAERAGIQVRDVVLEIDGKPTRDTPALLARIAELPPGSTVTVKVWRDRKLQGVDVTVARRPQAQ